MPWRAAGKGNSPRLEMTLSLVQQIVEVCSVITMTETTHVRRLRSPRPHGEA
jgi:hypothetical protein